MNREFDAFGNQEVVMPVADLHDNKFILKHAYW